MFGLGTYEVLVVAIVAIVIVGPKDLPIVLRTFFNLTRKAQAIAREFRRGIEELAEETGLDAVKKDLRSAAKGEFLGDIGEIKELDDLVKDVKGNIKSGSVVDSDGETTDQGRGDRSIGETPAEQDSVSTKV